MKRLLFISHCVPHPPDKGERIRAYQELLALRADFRISLACLCRDEGDRRAARQLRGLCEQVVAVPVGGKVGLVRGAIGQLTGRSVTEGFLHSRRLLNWLKGLPPGREFDLAIGYSSGVLQYLLAAPAGARVMDLVDIDSAKWNGYAEQSGRLSGWLYERESRRVAQLEVGAIRACDAVVCVSEAEVRAAPRASRKLCVVPNGVDGEFFRPTQSAAQAGPVLVFVGSMDYRPNVDAVCWFAAEVWPRLRARFDPAQFHIVGRNPTRAVRRLAGAPGVTVTGSVPDVRPYLSRARVAVTPLRMARGVQNKVLEAMAMARPTVASAAALEGLSVDVGVNILQADTPAQWLERLSDLLTSPERCGRIGAAARSMILSKYRWEACMAPLTALCRRLVGDGAAARRQRLVAGTYVPSDKTAVVRHD